MRNSRLRSSQLGSVSLVPVMVVFFSITAFLGMMWYALPPSGTTAVRTNTSLSTGSTLNSTIAANTTTAIIVPIKDWKIYTAPDNAFSVQYPTTSMAERCDQSDFFSPLPPGAASLCDGAYQGIFIEKRSESTVAAAVAQDKLVATTTIETTATIAGLPATHLTWADQSAMGAGGITWDKYYVLTSNGLYVIANSDVAQASIFTTFIGTLSFPVQPAAVTQPSAVTNDVTTSSDNAVVPNETPIVSYVKYPIIKVSDIRSLMGSFGEAGASAVSIMGERALIGGGGKLYLYDGTKVQDISDKIALSSPNPNQYLVMVTSIENNGSYWLISTNLPGEQTDHIYTYDGETWRDWSAELRSASHKTFFGGRSAAWNGNYWLIGDNPSRLVRFDGSTFTDITAQVPNPETSKSFGKMVWNGRYFLIPAIGSGNYGKIYKYDGTTVTEITGLASTNNITTVGWNGVYWLFAGFNNQHLLKYDGTTISDLGAATNQQATIAWLKSVWLVGQYFFDGATLDTASSPFSVGYRVNHVSLGKHFGILLGENGSIYRFDF